MGIFTIHDNPDVDRKIQSELDIITGEILSYTHPTTILLAGSFGRGEGSVLIRDAHIIPVMDYDLLIIAEKNSLLAKKELEDVKKRIIERCQLGELERHIITDCHIDLFQSSPDEFRSNAHLSIYDMQTGSIVLYGDDIRDSIDIDIARLGPSACYFSLFRSIQSLLDIFSADYFITPPSNNNRFSLIFFCGKIYLHMGTQLSLLHDLYDSSCRKRVERISDKFPLLYPDLAGIVPDLPDKIRFFSELTLSPDAILKESIDPVELWFETRRDFEIVMKYCLNEIGKMDSDDWLVLSDQLYHELRTKYYAYFIEYWLEKRYHIQSSLISSFINAVYPLRKVPQVARGKNGGIRTLKGYFTSPLLKIFAISPLFLFSLRRNGSIDNELHAKFLKEFLKNVQGYDSISSRTDLAGWESTRKVLKDLLK